MDARYYNGEPDWRDDANECEMKRTSLSFEVTREAMLDHVRRAADPAVAQWAAYRGDIINIAVFYVKHVVRDARNRGLYPTMAQLEADMRQRHAA